MLRRTFCASAAVAYAAEKRITTVSIERDSFYINGRPTYRNRSFQGHNIEGLLMNTRMVQATFDDENPETRSRWAYPDTKTWDPDRNTSEFIAQMPEWKRHGILAFTVNLQGGSPQGYSKAHPWHNSAFTESGSLKPAYLGRLKRILDRADQLGMVPILGYFYFGQDQRLRDEAAVRTGVINATNWILDQGYRNVLIEINNECNVKAYDHEILKPARVHELILLAKQQSRGSRRLLVGTSYGGQTPALPNVIRTSDFLLLHGNGRDNPARMREVVEQTRAAEGYRIMPVLVNEDDHFRFEDPDSHLMTMVAMRVSWGYFDPGVSDYRDGFQCPPVNWSASTERKRAFLAKIKEITGV
jgi:hypothetical protein